MDNTWIKLYRRSLGSSIWIKPHYWFIWCWVLMKASHKEIKISFKNIDITLKSGSFITTRTTALSELPGIGGTQYRTALKYLNSTHRITSKTTSKFTIIQVQNWDKYQNNDQQNDQQNDQPVTSQQPASNQRQYINKNDKNDKKILTAGKPSAKIDYLSNIPLEDIHEMENVSAANEQQIRAKAGELIDWCYINGKRKKDYKAFLRVAVVKDYPKLQAKNESSMETYGYIKR